MKLQRALTITLTVALFGGLTFMGFAGTAAAQDVNLNDIDFGDQTSGDANATTNIDVDQDNNNAQVGVSNAEATSEAASLGSYYTKHGGAGEAFSASDATSVVVQDQDVTQSNSADIDAETNATTGDNVQAILASL
ncbi:hypothetical protein [Natrinema salsiterrestre]|uniref:Uncharacterized protein n=1 Tax=Natrinema salsiterrestre TaxID=2950540 RepID=A0A9Q4KZM3_9EURY|nr:hypothetical protein [Natrinema salsiterrestre]MDF9743983.1 hypothetical protein [Natrinema salsiterrestre]